VPNDGVFTRIVGSQDEGKVAVEQIHEVTDVADAAVDIGFGMKGILYLKRCRRCRHELHQAPCADGRNGPVIEIRFRLDDGFDQGGVDAVSFRGPGNQIVVKGDIPFQLEDDTLLLHDQNIGDIGFRGDVGQVDDPLRVCVFVDVRMA